MSHDLKITYAGAEIVLEPRSPRGREWLREALGCEDPDAGHGCAYATSMSCSPRPVRPACAWTCRGTRPRCDADVLAMWREAVTARMPRNKQARRANARQVTAPQQRITLTEAWPPLSDGTL
jgi:hypothetical protein